MFENCEYDNTAEVSAVDFAFEGLPDELPAGRTAFLLTNDGTEAHELGLARKADGVTESFDEILEMPEEDAMELVEFSGGAFAAGAGSQGMAVADLEPGEYVAACFVPVGTSMEGDEMTEGEGPPHFMEGMKQEFTVTE